MQTKNQISLTRKTLYGLVSLAIFFAAFSAGSLPTASAQQAETATATPPEITDDEIVTLLMDTLKQLSMIGNNEELVTFQIQRDTSGIIVIGYTVFEKNNPPQFVEPSLALANYVNNKWEIQVPQSYNEEYDIWLLQVSAELLPNDAKQYYMVNNSVDSSDEITAQAYTGHFLPWQNGVSHAVTQWPASSSNSPKHGTYPKESGAWDWYMPIGTEIWASQAGTVSQWVYESSTNPSVSLRIYVAIKLNPSTGSGHRLQKSNMFGRSTTPH